MYLKSAYNSGCNHLPALPIPGQITLTASARSQDFCFSLCPKIHSRFRIYIWHIHCVGSCQTVTQPICSLTATIGPSYLHSGLPISLAPTQIKKYPQNGLSAGQYTQLLYLLALLIQSYQARRNTGLSHPGHLATTILRLFYALLHSST